MPPIANFPPSSGSEPSSTCCATGPNARPPSSKAIRISRPDNHSTPKCCGAVQAGKRLSDVGLFELLAATAALEDQAVERLARRYRLAIYEAFRGDRPQYDRRLQAWQRVQAAWIEAGAHAHERPLLIDWLTGSFSRFEAGSFAKLPARPVFGRALTDALAPAAEVTTRPTPALGNRPVVSTEIRRSSAATTAVTAAAPVVAHEPAPQRAPSARGALWLDLSAKDRGSRRRRPARSLSVEATASTWPRPHGRCRRSIRCPYRPSKRRNFPLVRTRRRAAPSASPRTRTIRQAPPTKSATRAATGRNSFRPRSSSIAKSWASASPATDTA